MWRQHLGDKLERVCPGQDQPDPITDEKECCLSPKLIGMVQEAENYRDEHEANESKDEAENGLENYCLIMRKTLTGGNSRSSRAVTDTDEDMFDILITDDSQAK